MTAPTKRRLVLFFLGFVAETAGATLATFVDASWPVFLFFAVCGAVAAIVTRDAATSLFLALGGAMTSLAAWTIAGWTAFGLLSVVFGLFGAVAVGAAMTAGTIVAAVFLPKTEHS